MSVSQILNSNGLIPSSLIEGGGSGPSSIPPLVSVLDIGNDASYNSITNVSSLSIGNLSPSVNGNLNLYTVKGNSFGGLSNLELNFLSSVNGALGDLGASNISSERFMSRNIYIPSPTGNSQVYLSTDDTSTLNLNNSNISNVGNIQCSTISPNCKGIILQSGELNDSSPLFVEVPNIQSTSNIIFSLKSASSVSLGSGIDYLGLETINTTSTPYGFSFYVGSEGSGLSITGGQIFNYIVYN